MSESLIDVRRARYDPSFDTVLTVEQSVRLHDERVAYERRKWHREHDAPPEGYGLDGRPLMQRRVESGELRVERTEGDG